MCQNCNNYSCSGCYQPCPQFPPPPGPPGQVGPIGPQGPPGILPPFNIVNFTPICVLPGQCPYTCDGSEDVILVNTPTPPQSFSTVDIYLLPANDPNAAKRVVRIKDANYYANVIDIVIHPDGTDSIENGAPGATLSLFLNVGIGGSITLVTDKTSKYLIV